MAAHAHALLTAAEITETVELVRSLGLAEEATFRRMAVAEGQDDERHIEVWLYRQGAGEIDELIVSLTTGQLVSKSTVSGEYPQPGFGEFEAAQAVVKGDPRVAEAVAKRGITDTSKLQVDTWPTGNMGLDVEEGHRTLRCILFFRSNIRRFCWPPESCSTGCACSDLLKPSLSSRCSAR